MTVRLSPEHYAPVRVPYEVLRHSATPGTLAAGSPGKIGLLELGFEQLGGRSELVAHYQKSPLQIMRPPYFDPSRPDLAMVILMSTGGGILQADRLRLDLHCGADTSVHFTTRAATKLHRMDHDYATQMVNLTASSGAYVEYLPEPTIPCGGSRFYQRTVVTADPTATVLVSESLFGGRLSRGERNAYDVLALDFELRRPSGELVVLDAIRMEPPAVAGPAVLGEHHILSSFYVVSPLASPTVLADALHEALAESGLTYGVSVLPGECGAWLRALGDDPRAMALALRTAWDAVRRLLIGVPAPHPSEP
jgi:urease accessory protein